MITFFISCIALILGYTFYSKFVEKVFGIDVEAVTPAIRLRDNVDYLPLPGWKIFMIQFLNIAGLGPIFGAIAGALFGPVAFIWIVIGSIFAGAVHDYTAGMLSLKHDGISIAELVGIYLGKPFMIAIRIISVILLILVGVIFVSGPASILHSLTNINETFLIYIIFFYYLIATLVPVDKIIGRIYPIFSAALIFMALGVFSMLFIKGYQIPELYGNMYNMQVKPLETPIFPMLFITIACGAISGFHSTQSPLMARCMTSQSQGRNIFYGSMIAEGFIALIWAAAAMAFFGGIEGLSNANLNGAQTVSVISNTLLGSFGGALAVFGVVAAPITSGDTSFRSARLTISDAFKIKQKSIKSRLFVAIPLFIIAFILTKIDFSIIWRYFGFTNQLIATFALWTVTSYLFKNSKQYLITFIPAIFMTAVCTSFILMSKIGLNLPVTFSQITGTVFAVVLGVIAITVFKKNK